MGYGVTQSIKYFKTLKIWKNSTGTCEFSAEFKRATSYGHWCFLKVIRGKLIFNHYSYSQQTNAHQSCVREVLAELKMKIHAEVCQHRSLDHGIEVNSYVYELEMAKYKLTRKGLSKKTRARLQWEISINEKALKTLRKLGVSVPRKLLKELRAKVKRDEDSRLASLKIHREKRDKVELDANIKGQLSSLESVDLLGKMNELQQLDAIKI